MKKRIFLIVLCVALMLCLSSCQKATTVSDAEDSYLEGLERGERNIFFTLVNASSCQKVILWYDEVWETEDFSLRFTDFKSSDVSLSDYDSSDDLFLKCELTLNDFTIDEGDEKNNIYLGMYSLSENDEWNKIVSNYGEYYSYAVLEDGYTFGSYTSKATFGLYDNQKFVFAIIVVNGNLYNVMYILNEK